MKRLLALLMCVAMLVCLCACGTASTTTNETSADEAGEAASDAEADDDYYLELNLSHVFAPGEALTTYMDKIAENVEEATDGHIKITTYPQSQMPVYQDGVAQVAQGANFISVEDPSYLADYVADFNVLAGPMLVTSYDQYLALLETDEVQQMLSDLEDKGIKVLNLSYIFGFRSMMTNKVIETPDDLKGMKIRTPKSELYVNTINAMGATATPMGFADTISAVQQGVVDGLEGTIDAYGSNGSAEVCKNMALTKHLLGVCGAYINVDVYNSIPEKYRTILQDEFDKGAKEMIEFVTQNEETQKAALEEEYGVQFNEVDLDAFKELMLPIYQDMVENKGTTDGLYEKFQDYIKDID